MSAPRFETCAAVDGEAQHLARAGKRTTLCGRSAHRFGATHDCLGECRECKAHRELIEAVYESVSNKGESP